jgi:1-deoxy-D-xylulose-5-phosphate reductoisomerase
MRRFRFLGTVKHGSLAASATFSQRLLHKTQQSHDVLLRKNHLMPSPKNIAILGSTGSIGQSALDVVRNVEGLNVVGLSGHSNLDLLTQQALEFQPRFVVATDPETRDSFKIPGLKQTEVLSGADALEKMVTSNEVDIVLAAIVGKAGLASTWAAIECGKTIALANKETLVVAGNLMTELAQSTGATIIPVDSEHSAVFQALAAGNAHEVRRVVLTASGGPFRDWDTDQLKNATVEQALAHPTWEMGQKISVDSATMMNKSLEIIEARWLFDLRHDQIDVVIHPQSIVHSLVEFQDGSIIAQLSPPDMKLPIQYAFTYPDRVAGVCPRLDFTSAMQWDFIPPDVERFPALELGYEVARLGGSTGAVLNAANEAAVAAFLNRQISFTDITTACRAILDQHNYEPHPTLDAILAADRWARNELTKWT